MKLALLPAVLLLCACTGPDSIEFGGGTMGTGFTVKLPRAADAHDGEQLRAEVQALLQDVSQMMSTYIADSEISRFNDNASMDWQTVSRDFCDSVQLALELSVFSDGAFDITAGPLVDVWGFGPVEREFALPEQAAIEAARARVGFEHLQTDCETPAIRRSVDGLTLDMSAIGKGYAADRVADMLAAKGLDDYLVEIGGELRVSGSNADGEAWAIGIELPHAGKREPYAVVHVTDVAVATSGDYRNFYVIDGVRYSHEIDTRTGYPVTHELSAVSIIDETGARADALATGLLVMGPDKGMELATRENIAALFLTRTESGIEEAASPRFSAIRRTL